MKHFHTCATVVALLFCTGLATGQVSFSDQTILLNNPTGFTSGNVLAIADMNADGLDDIVRMNFGSMLSIEYQTPNGQPFTNHTHGNVPEDAWAIVVGDVNNDGFCDIMAGGSYDGVKVLIAMNSGQSYLSSTLPGPGLFVQGSNMADINNDGFLDIFACHDDGESRIWRGMGTGLFTQADQWIDMRTVPTSDNSGNYGSVWTDFDNDGDLDLYIAKCRIGVGDPNDPRRINALFVNDGQNNFQEAAGEHGLKIGHQSWTSDFQDIDNDGDLDCFITNHDYDLQLLENDGTGHFTEISAAAGIATGNGDNFVQGIMKDFDNDGFVDIITAQPTLFFRNNGDKTFTEMDPFGEDFGSLATGDLNHDGFLDLYTAYQCNFNSPCGTPDKLLMNGGNDNHFLSLSLTGTQSNKMGVGARIELHGPWGIQVREVRAGESYGIMNSLSQNFGLGSAGQADFVVVKWPSGTVDVLSGVGADQFLNIVEGSTCSLPGFQLTDSPVAVLCNGESITLTAPPGYTYLWNDGSTEQTRVFNTPGHYTLVIVDALGCAAISETVKIVLEPDETPTVAISGETIFCEGASVVLTSTPAASHLWSNGETTPAITVAQSGDYQVTVEGACRTFDSETIHIEVLENAATPTANGVSVMAPASAQLEATGENPHWFDSIDGPDPLAIGNTFNTPELTATTTYFVADAKTHGGGEANTGMPEHQGTPFNGPTFNGQILFDVLETITLKQVTVATDSNGANATRIIELLGANNAVLNSVSVNVPEGETVVDLDFTIGPGSYKLTTNTANNQAVLGTTSPRLRRADAGVQYPYEVPGVLTITGSNFGSGFYYYFFDWKIELPAKKCFSERVPVTVTVLPNAVREVSPFGKLSVVPNPSNGAFTLEIEAFGSGNAQLVITDVTGQAVFTDHFPIKQGLAEHRFLDLGNAPTGMYFLKITDGERASWLKLIKE